MLIDPVPGLLARATEVFEAEFGSLPAFLPDPAHGEDAEAIARVLETTAHRLGDNYPYFHPLYSGQSLKPHHPARGAAYAPPRLGNPSNHCHDGGRARY